jgi:hypothetical protein
LERLALNAFSARQKEEFENQQKILQQINRTFPKAIIYYSGAEIEGLISISDTKSAWTRLD